MPTSNITVKRRKGPLVEALRVATPRPVLQHIEAHAGDWIVTKFRALYSGDKSLAFFKENRQAVVNGLIGQLWEPLLLQDWSRRRSPLRGLHWPEQDWNPAFRDWVRDGRDWNLALRDWVRDGREWNPDLGDLG